MEDNYHPIYDDFLDDFNDYAFPHDGQNGEAFNFNDQIIPKNDSLFQFDPHIIYMYFLILSLMTLTQFNQEVEMTKVPNFENRITSMDVSFSQSNSHPIYDDHPEYIWEGWVDFDREVKYIKVLDEDESIIHQIYTLSQIDMQPIYDEYLESPLKQHIVHEINVSSQPSF